MLTPTQPPEGLLDKITEVIEGLTWRKVNREQGGSDRWATATSPEDMADAVLAALFEACEVHVRPHSVLFGGERTPRTLVLSYPLPDEPLPEPSDGLADLLRERIGEIPPVPAFDDEETR